MLFPGTWVRKTKGVIASWFYNPALQKKADFSSPGTTREARSVTKAATALPQGISVLEWQIPKPSLLHGAHHA